MTMDSDLMQSSLLRVLLVLATLVVIIAGMRASASILVPFLLSIFIAVIGTSPLFWLQQKGLPLWIALLTVIIAIVGSALLIAILIGASLDGFSQELPAYQSRLQEYVSDAATWLQNHGSDVSIERIGAAFDPGRAINMANSVLSSVGSLLSNVFLILFTVIFMLLEASSLPGKLNTIMGDGQLQALRKMAESIKQYLAIKTFVSALTGIIIYIMLLLLGVDFPFLWAMLAFMFNYVPDIGSIIAAVPAVLICFIQLGPGIALVVTIGYVAVNIIFGNLIEPRVMGRQVGLSTLVVFLSLIFWGWVLGPMGMVLSVPLTMAVKVMLETNEQTRWVSVLLGTADDIKPEAA